MQKQFVTYEISLKLKDLGFDEKCLGCYVNNELEIHKPEYLTSQKKAQYIYKFNNTILAPLWQQVIDWFRDEKFINIEINRFPNINKWGFITTNMNIIPKYLSYKEMIIYNNLVTSPNRYDTYEDARVAAILQAIEIELNKN